MTLRDYPKVLDWPRRVVAVILTAAVLLGGVFPPLYGEVLPHEHLFVGGPPPVNWQSHEHPNPLITLLRASAHPSATVNGTNAEALPTNALAQGQVVSLYSGSLLLVVTIFALDLALPLADALPPPPLVRQIEFVPAAARSAPIQAPPLPPPRARFSAGLRAT